MKLLLIVCFAAVAAGASQAGLPERAAQLLEAIRKGQSAVATKLIDSEPTLVDTRGDDGVSAVRLALYYRHPELSRVLIARAAKLDLYDAAAAGETGRLRELVANNVSLVNTRSGDGATALGLAAFFGQLDSVEFLLNEGAQIDMLATNPAFPFTPLHSALSAGHKEIVELLLARGADVNVREGGGLTVLHEAAGLGSLDDVKLLLAHKANPNAKTDGGKLPEDFARERNFNEVAELLREGGLK